MEYLEDQLAALLKTDKRKVAKKNETITIALAKEREAKIIRAAYHFCVSLSNTNDLKDAESLLYRIAKLEELK